MIITETSAHTDKTERAGFPVFWENNAPHLFLGTRGRLTHFLITEHSANQKVGIIVIVPSTLGTSCFPHCSSSGPSEKGQNLTCSYFLSGKTRHWTAVRLKHLLLTINLQLVWTPTWKFSEKSTGWLQLTWARSNQRVESNELTQLNFKQCLSYKDCVK